MARKEWSTKPQNRICRYKTNSHIKDQWWNGISNLHVETRVIQVDSKPAQRVVILRGVIAAKRKGEFYYNERKNVPVREWERKKERGGWRSKWRPAKSFLIKKPHFPGKEKSACFWNRSGANLPNGKRQQQGGEGRGSLYADAIIAIIQSLEEL